ncbi:MAG: pyridoxamine 5'-phosphate oxidase family protein [Candidatus Omnitrophota bacterium]
MEKDALKDRILDVIKGAHLATLATISEGKPAARYMVIHQDDGLNLYTVTFANSRKVKQISQNNNVYVLIGGEPKNYQAPYVNIQATAGVLSDPETKKRCWSESLKSYFSGPEDPNYVVIKITSQVIEYMAPNAHHPETYTV